MANEVSVNFIDNPTAPDLFAAEAVGFFNLNGSIMITLSTPHVNHETSPGPINRVVVGRVVMPAAGAVTLAAGLYNFLKEQGFDLGGGQGQEKAN